MLSHEQFQLIYMIIVIILTISVINSYITHETLLIPKNDNNDTDDFSEKPTEVEYKKYINSAHTGLIRGIIFGLLMDRNLEVAIKNGAIYGIVNPIIVYIGCSS